MILELHKGNKRLVATLAADKENKPVDNEEA